MRDSSSAVARIAVVAAMLVATLLMFLSAMVVTPTASYVMYPLTVGSSEMSPFLVLLDLLWCLVIVRTLRSMPRVRLAGMTLLIAAALIAVRPLTRFTQTAASASRQLGTASPAPRFSLLTAIRGLPVEATVSERTVHYTAEDATPLTMRLFSPSSAGAKPTVVVIYGGAWRGNDATQCANVSRSLAARGYTVAAVDYRHAPRFRFPAQLDDIRRALALLRDSSVAFNVDVRRIAILGRSSGGQLATLTAFTSSKQDVPIKAVIALYAPYDLAQGYRDLPSPDPIDVRQVLRDFVGGTPDELPVRYHDASPASYVRQGLPPVMLIYGAMDHVIKPEFNRGATRDLRIVHVPVVSIELPWAEHGFDMAPAGLGAQLAFYAISEFLDRELKRR